MMQGFNKPIKTWNTVFSSALTLTEPKVENQLYIFLNLINGSPFRFHPQEDFNQFYLLFSPTFTFLYHTTSNVLTTRWKHL